MFVRIPSSLALVLALSVISCDGKKDKPSSTAKEGDAKAVDAKAEGKADAAKPEEGQKPAGKEGASEECTAYAGQFCEKAGKDSPLCRSLEELTVVLPPQACKTGSEHLDYSVQKIEDMKKVCTELMDKLCKDIGEETDSCKMVREQTQKFPPDKCKGMMDKYDSVLEELKSMEARNKPLDEAAAKEIATGDNVPTFGPEDAKVTIVEFSDFQCPYCSRAADVTNQVKEKYGDKVRFVFRQFPLNFHKEAHLASQAALAAHAQGKFWPYHDLLFKNQRALGIEDLRKYAKEIGLDLGKFNKALEDKTYAKQVDDELELGKKVFVSGTPTMFLNGKRIGNATDFGSVSAEIEKELSGGGDAAKPDAAPAEGEAEKKEG